VQQVDLHLRRAVLVDQRVDLDVLRFAERVDVVEQRIELVDRRDAVRLAADLGAARAADRRLERIVGVGVRLDQVELELGRDDRLPAPRGIEVEDVAQHVTRRHGHRPAVGIEAVVDHLRGRLRSPRHDARRCRVGLHHDVDLRRADRAVVFRIVARHGLQEDALGHAHALVFRELHRRHHLATRDAGHVGHDGLDFGNAVLLEELLDRGAHA
jgi:hypothetical protein